MEKYTVKIAGIVEEGKHTKTYFLEKPDDLLWEEGAHMHVGLAGFDAGEQPNKEWVRHMSIMTLPEEGNIGFTTRFPAHLSEFKQRLAALQAGDELVLFKTGSRMTLRRENKPLILVSMGVGIATMRPLVLRFAGDSSNIRELVNLNVDSSEQYIFQKELDSLQSSQYHNIWASSRSAFYEALEEAASQADAYFYVVGSDLFLQDVIQLLRAKQIPADQIILDKKEMNLPLYFGA